MTEDPTQPSSVGIASPPVVIYPGPDQPDLVRGTRIAVQCLPPPLNGRCGKIVDYDSASQAYVVHVDGGNPRTLYRENLRILDDQSVPVMPVKRATGRPQAPRSSAAIRHQGGGGEIEAGPTHYVSGQIKPGDQILLCVEQFQFTLMEVTGIRKVCKSEPCSYAIAAILDDADVPAWMKRPPPVAARPPSSRTGSGPKVPGFRVGDPIYAVWDQDGRWYPGKIFEDLGDRFEIEWSDKEAELSVVKKSLVCRRTAFDDMRNRPSYLGALNLASRTGGMKGMLKNGAAGAGGSVEYDDEELETLHRIKEEESKRKAAIGSEQLFGKQDVAHEMISSDQLSAEEWSTVLSAMKIMGKFGIDGLVSSNRGEVFHIPPKFPKDVPAVTPSTPTEKTGEESMWDSEASHLLHGWLMQGKYSLSSHEPPPTVEPSSLGANGATNTTSLVAPSRSVLEASLSRALRKPVALPRGPLDIFRPPAVKSE